MSIFYLSACAYNKKRYNYVTYAIEILRKGDDRYRHVPTNRTDEFYESNYLFSFEDFIRSELKVLKECLLTRRGAKETKEMWLDYSWAQKEFKRRKKRMLPPLVDLIGVCYGDKVTDKVLRKQWIELLDGNPTKVIPRNRHHVSKRCCRL